MFAPPFYKKNFNLGHVPNQFRAPHLFYSGKKKFQTKFLHTQRVIKPIFILIILNKPASMPKWKPKILLQGTGVCRRKKKSEYYEYRSEVSRLFLNT